MQEVIYVISNICRLVVSLQGLGCFQFVLFFYHQGRADREPRNSSSDAQPSHRGHLSSSVGIGSLLWHIAIV